MYSNALNWSDCEVYDMLEVNSIDRFFPLYSAATNIYIYQDLDSFILLNYIRGPIKQVCNPPYFNGCHSKECVNLTNSYQIQYHQI